MKPFHSTEILWFTAGDEKKLSRHQNYTEKTEMIRETKTSNLTNDYFGYYKKRWERSNWKIEGRRKRKLKVSKGSCRSCLPCFIAVVLVGVKRYGYITIRYVSRYRAHDTIRITICFYMYMYCRKLKELTNFWVSNFAIYGECTIIPMEKLTMNFFTGNTCTVNNRQF